MGRCSCSRKIFSTAVLVATCFNSAAAEPTVDGQTHTVTFAYKPSVSDNTSYKLNPSQLYLLNDYKTLRITGGTNWNTKILAGFSMDNVDLCGYQLIVSEAALSLDYGRGLYGAQNSGVGNANGNSLSISNSTFNSRINAENFLYGGYAWGGNANQNTVTVTDTTFNNKTYIYGGSATATQGEARENQVIITGSSFAKETQIVGAQAFNAAVDNQVIINGPLSEGSSEKLHLYGYTSTNVAVNHQNNSLAVNGVEGKFASVNNFDQIVLGEVTWGRPQIKAMRFNAIGTLDVSELNFTSAEGEELPTVGTTPLLVSDRAGDFGDDNIASADKYQRHPFTATGSVTLDGEQYRGLELTLEGDGINYTVGQRRINAIDLGEISWEHEATVLNAPEYDYAAADITADNFSLAFAAPVEALPGERMTLLSANDTLQSVFCDSCETNYTFSPQPGINIAAHIVGELACTAGAVTYTVSANRADNLTFAEVPWLEEGALMTRPNNVSFEGAAVNTEQISFGNVAELTTGKNMTLVEDFGDAVGPIVGDRYSIGTTLEGKGHALLENRNLVYAIDVGTNQPEETTEPSLPVEDDESTEQETPALPAENDEVATDQFPTTPPAENQTDNPAEKQTENPPHENLPSDENETSEASEAAAIPQEPAPTPIPISAEPTTGQTTIEPVDTSTDAVSESEETAPPKSAPTELPQEETATKPEMTVKNAEPPPAVDTPDGSATSRIVESKPSLTVQEQTHNAVMSAAAGMAALTAGNNAVDGAIADLTADGNIGPDGVAVYASVGGADTGCETGSYVEARTWNAILALGTKKESKAGTWEWGAFFEYGRANYTTYNGAIRGDGASEYTGGGLLLKWTAPNKVYVEASFRGGTMKDESANTLRDGAGNAYGYDTKAPYRGFHLGLGKIYGLSSEQSLDIYGKFFYNRRGNMSFNAGGEYDLDAVASKIMRLGFRYSWGKEGRWQRYLGGAYEYEFDGVAGGMADGLPIRSADTGGNSFLGEFGLKLEPSQTSPWRADVGIKAAWGKRWGWGGQLSLAYLF